MQKEGGIKGFYQGYDSAIMRQAVYTTARFGLFLNISDHLKQKNNGANLSFGQKGIASLTAGGVASFIGNPCDLILIRMQADSTLPAEQRRNYKSFFDAAKRIPSEEGITSLWKGGVPTVTRAMALNFGMFSTYEEAKERFGKMMSNKTASWGLATILAGALAATYSLPFDNAKTKMQKMKADPKTGLMPYKNIFDCMGKTVGEVGVTGLWVGLPTYITRIAPHVMISLTVSEYLKKAFFG
jgi:solute carrier family 25 oxoglutarate transporter 11